jgi:hypothetical protein
VPWSVLVTPFVLRSRPDGIRQRRILEPNAGHALVQGFRRRRFDANPDTAAVGDYAEFLLG